MQALSDEQRIESLEKKIDEGFAEMRTEFEATKVEMRTEFRDVRTELRGELNHRLGEIHADIRGLATVLFGMFMTMILGFAAILLQHL